MKVIICGAGEVGKTLAQHLSKEKNDITIIDQSDESLKEIINSFNDLKKKKIKDLLENRLHRFTEMGVYKEL